MKKIERLPSRKYLKKVFRYDPETGELRWRKRSDAGRSFNKRWRGRLALNYVGDNGYRRGGLNGKHAYQHRVIFKMMTGLEPPQIDHRDGCRTNNKWDNLAAATALDNARNVTIKSSNKSGRTGVHQNARGKWIVQIRNNGGARHIGSFDDFDMACAARAAAEKEIGFIARQGRADAV